LLRARRVKPETCVTFREKPFRSLQVVRKENLIWSENLSLSFMVLLRVEL
jgi:hypothetical protein